MIEYPAKFISLPNDEFEVLIFIVAATVKVGLLLLPVIAVCRLIESFASAATRHLLLFVGILAALAIPVLSIVKGIEVKIPFPSILAFERKTDVQTADAFETNDVLPTGEDSVNTQIFVDRSGQAESFDSAENERIGDKSFVSMNEIGKSDGASSVLASAIYWLIGIWLIGATIFFIRLIFGAMMTVKLAKGAVEITEPEWTTLFDELVSELKMSGRVGLRRSSAVNMPIVCGLLRSVIILPPAADEWSAERRRMVLLHELAHVARRDCLIQFIARIAGVIYWYHPLVWWAVRKMQIERERACDDAVLRRGAASSDYAYHLLEIARSVREKNSLFNRSENLNVALIYKSPIELRVTSILDSRLSRLNPNIASKMLLTTTAFAIVFSLAALQINSQTETRLAETIAEVENFATSMPVLMTKDFAFNSISFVQNKSPQTAQRKKFDPDSKRERPSSKSENIREKPPSSSKPTDSRQNAADDDNDLSKLDWGNETEDWETRSRKFRAASAIYWEKRNREFAAYTEAENRRRQRELRERQIRFEAYTEAENLRRSKELRERRERFAVYTESERLRRNRESNSRARQTESRNQILN